MERYFNVKRCSACEQCLFNDFQSLKLKRDLEMFLLSFLVKCSCQGFTPGWPYIFSRWSEIHTRVGQKTCTWRKLETRENAPNLVNWPVTDVLRRSEQSCAEKNQKTWMDSLWMLQWSKLNVALCLGCEPAISSVQTYWNSASWCIQRLCKAKDWESTASVKR